MSMDKMAYAARFRDWARATIKSEVKKVQPGDRYGTISAIDWTAMRAELTFAGGTDIIRVRFGYSCQPTNVGQRVRVSGEVGDRYISELVTAPTTTDATLSGAWVNVGGFASNAGYLRDQTGTVYLRGRVSGGAITGSPTIFTLPVGYRPAGVLLLPVRTGNGATSTLQVNFTGDVAELSTGISSGRTVNTQEVSLDGISFRAA